MNQDPNRHSTESVSKNKTKAGKGQATIFSSWANRLARNLAAQSVARKIDNTGGSKGAKL